MQYTSDDLLREAKAKGFQASSRMILDWTEQGLLDRPEKRGLGQGKGSTAYWPENQFRLFLVLLEKRKETSRIGPMFNIPVWLWLAWGDDYVPLRQVRRALATWGESVGIPQRGVPWGQARKAAKELVRQVSHPKSEPKDRHALQEALFDMICNSTLDQERLYMLVEAVFDPKHTGRPRGPMGAKITAQNIVDMIVARHRVILQLPDISDDLFNQARSAYLASLQSYLLEQPALAQDPDLGKLFNRPTQSQIIMNSCIDLITILSLVTRPAMEAKDIRN